MSNPAIADLYTPQAKGQIGRQSIYYVVYGYQRKRSYVVPTDPQSPRQLSKRAFFRNGMAYWHSQSQSYRDSYITRAKRMYPSMLGYNLFMRDWLKGRIVMECIKSIQRGNTVCSAGQNDIAITAVDLAKSIIRLSGYALDEAGDGSKKLGIIGGILTSSTNLRVFAIKDATASSPRALWEVIEYY